MFWVEPMSRNRAALILVMMSDNAEQSLNLP